MMNDELHAIREQQERLKPKPWPPFKMPPEPEESTGEVLMMMILVSAMLILIGALVVGIVRDVLEWLF